MYITCISMSTWHLYSIYIHIYWHYETRCLSNLVLLNQIYLQSYFMANYQILYNINVGTRHEKHCPFCCNSEYNSHRNISQTCDIWISLSMFLFQVYCHNCQTNHEHFSIWYIYSNGTNSSVKTIYNDYAYDTDIVTNMYQSYMSKHEHFMPYTFSINNIYIY